MIGEVLRGKVGAGREDHVVLVWEQMRTELSRNLRTLACDRQEDKIGNGMIRANTSVYVKQTQFVIPQVLRLESRSMPITTQ
jgi:hypothetical protein